MRSNRSVLSFIPADMFFHQYAFKTFQVNSRHATIKNWPELYLGELNRECAKDVLIYLLFLFILQHTKAACRCQQ